MPPMSLRVHPWLMNTLAPTRRSSPWSQCSGGTRCRRSGAGRPVSADQALRMASCSAYARRLSASQQANARGTPPVIARLSSLPRGISRSPFTPGNLGRAGDGTPCPSAPPAALPVVDLHVEVRADPLLAQERSHGLPVRRLYHHRNPGRPRPVGREQCAADDQVLAPGGGSPLTPVREHQEGRLVGSPGELPHRPPQPVLEAP